MTIVLPIGSPPLMGGVDGVTYEIAIKQPPHYISLSAKCRLSWWVEPPLAWGALRDWVKRAEHFFEAAWVEHGDAMYVPLWLKPDPDATAVPVPKRLQNCPAEYDDQRMLTEYISRNRTCFETEFEQRVIEL